MVSNLPTKKPSATTQFAGMLASNKLNVLVVDDEEFNLEILLKHLKKAGYDPVAARSGEEAWQYLTSPQGRGVNIVLLDKMMPGMNGIEVLKRMKSHPEMQHITVILQTASVGTQEFIEGINAGAYYYLTKPYAAELLLSIVNAAARDQIQQRKLIAELVARKEIISGIIKEAEFRFRTLDEARALAAYLGSFFEDSSKVMVGLAAILTNAVEHGNLHIGYETKKELVTNEAWEQEIANRLQLPENRNKYVRVQLKSTPEGMLITVEDEGEGFDWKEFIDFDPTRMTDPNGRGIALANITPHTKLRYLGKGNQVQLLIKPEGENLALEQ